MRFQKLMWRNMMRSTKSQKVSVLHYSIDILFLLKNMMCLYQDYNEMFNYRIKFKVNKKILNNEE